MYAFNLRPCLFFLAGLLVFQSCSPVSESETNTSNTPALTETSDTPTTGPLQEIAPPFQNIQLPVHNFEIDPAQPHRLEAGNGTTIEIEPNSFVDINGAPVTEPVRIQYREFQSAAELLLSGIPMEVVGANGEKMPMETAGMFELEGTTVAGGERVFIAENRDLTVNLASDAEGEYPFWFFDREKGNWKEIGTTTPAPNPVREAARQTMAATPKPKAPLKPALLDKSKPVLDFDVNYDNYPELRQLKGIMWQYSGTDARLDPVNNKWIFREPWDFVKLEPTDKPNEYKMVLTHGDKNFIIPVCPTLKDKDYKAAIEDFNRQAKAYREYVENKTAQKDLVKAQMKFIRTVKIGNFGIHNCDILYGNKKAVRLMANFDFGPLPVGARNMIPVYLISREGRSVVKYTSATWGNFIVDPTSKSALMAVLPNNKVAVFTARDFMNQREAIQAANNDVYDFKMQLIESDPSSPEDIQNIINAGLSI
ncbi:MAG: hypothetical protein D6714_11405 [Bacteroidetes bacterium]|nr:MAG: hypothetical protein D6714_11405 [Bacteroidota bacterium]